MAIKPESDLRDVTGISDSDKALIKAFMQGAVYCWVKNCKGEWFAVRDLMGGENYFWEGTPLYVLYEKHISAGKDNDAAIKSAAQDLGWLMKTVLHNDKRTFEARKAGLVAQYLWNGDEP